LRPWTAQPSWALRYIDGPYRLLVRQPSKGRQCVGTRLAKWPATQVPQVNLRLNPSAYDSASFIAVV
jgi:hypothetical protein